MSGKKWILLVAGSKGWENYKHQANVCLRYQIIKKHGIPDEQIVVMMYDDIANNPMVNDGFQKIDVNTSAILPAVPIPMLCSNNRINTHCPQHRNPTNGEIVSIVDGLDVYKGVPKDYTGKHLTPDNFLAALKGKKRIKQKVIDSGPDDHIYVYMTGLGREGTFQFLEKPLLPQDLTGTIKEMRTKSTFSKMVIYMDSDYSGSMFKGLPEDINVFALTSCHKYIENTPSDYDKKRQVYLSDLFSSTWLRHLNMVDFTKETFHDLVNKKQSKYIEDNPDEPCPCRFGTKDVTQWYLSEFLQKLTSS